MLAKVDLSVRYALVRAVANSPTFKITLALSSKQLLKIVCWKYFRY
jgi:hypothetical protein